jgi:hypothetical protein
MPPTTSGAQSRPSRYALFAARLKDAHAALRDPLIPAARRAELTKRVLGITALARHDVTVAASRLEGFFMELAGPPANRSVSDGDEYRAGAEAPSSGKNTATQG